VEDAVLVRRADGPGEADVSDKPKRGLLGWLLKPGNTGGPPSKPKKPKPPKKPKT
jgi:hypothetical protein